MIIDFESSRLNQEDHLAQNVEITRTAFLLKPLMVPWEGNPKIYSFFLISLFFCINFGSFFHMIIWCENHLRKWKANES
jgi:hypothetical protein